MRFDTRVGRNIAEAATVAPVKPAWAQGLRGAIATIIPMALGGALGLPQASWIGLAGFCATTADKGGAYATRAKAMAAVGVFGAIAAMLGSFAGRTPWLAIVLVAIVVTFCTMLRIYGQVAISVGTNAIVMYIVGFAAPASFRDAAARGAAVVAGALWAMVIALALWPIRFYRPARDAIANAFRRIAAYSRDVARIEQLSPGERHALFVGDYDATFTAINAARDVLAAIRRGRPADTRRGERLLVLLEKADRAFARLASLAESAESEHAIIDSDALSRVADACDAIARVIQSEQNETIGPVAAPHDVNGPAALLLTELQRAVDDAAGTALGVNSDRVRGIFEHHRERMSIIGTLRTALTWRSIVLRHALRVGLATAAAVWLSQILHLQRGYWVTFSAFIILQPYTTATFRKGLQRAVGTLLGGLLAALAVAVVHSQIGITALIFIGAFVCLALLPVNYGLYTIFMTPTFVLLAELGARDWHLAHIRIINTLLGCAIGFVAARVLWPSSERAAVREEIVAVVASLDEYVRAVIAADELLAISARRAAQLALLNADAALQQALSDPEARRGTSEPAMALIVHGRRFALALSAIAVATRGRREPLRPWLASVKAQLDGIVLILNGSASAGELAKLPPLATSDIDVAPLEQQLETIRDAAERFAAAM